MDKLTLAVECCLSNSTTWEETCGKCPFNTREKEDFIDNVNCIDALILALFNKVRALDAEVKVCNEALDNSMKLNMKLQETEAQFLKGATSSS